MKRILFLSLFVAALLAPVAALAQPDKKEEVSIGAGQNDSSEIRLDGGYCLVGIHVTDASWTASDLKAKSAEKPAGSGGTFIVVKDSKDADITFATSVSINESIDLTVDGKAICGFEFVKITSVTAQASAVKFFVILARNN